MPQETIIRVPLDAHTDWQELLHHLPPINSLVIDNPVILQIDYTCNSFLDCSVYPILSAFYGELASKGFTVTTTFDTSQQCDTVLYAGRIGFFDHVGVNYAYPHLAHDPGGRFIPITAVGQNGYGLDPRFAETIMNELGGDKELAEAVLFSITELIANINAHARSAHGGIVYGQIFPRKRTAVMTIVDAGRGVHRAFAEGTEAQYHGLSEEECLRICVNKDVTCGNGRGHGLFLIKEIIARNMGDLRIVSGDHYLSVINGIVTVRTGPYWQGALIIMEFDLNNKVNVNDVLTSNDYESILW
jgi:hypothetical protein